MPPFLNDPIQRLLARLTPSAPRALVALAGLPGSGKSTLAAHLAAEVNAAMGPDAMVALGMDGFHLPKAALRQMPDPEAAFARRGAPWTFDAPALVARPRELKDAVGRAPVGWPGFKHEIGDPIEDAVFVGPETRVVLVEGLDRAVNAVICMKDSVIDVCLNDRHTLIERCFDRRGTCLGLFAEAGKVRVEGLSVALLV